MVYANINDTMIKGPYQAVTKDKKEGRAPSSQRQDYAQQNSPNKNDKYGAWGSVYKNKKNFVDMHIC